MAFADELRKQTKTDQQRAMERRKSVLADKEQYVHSFRYTCSEAARRGERACTLIFQNNYDDNICNFYTDDYDTVIEIGEYVGQMLEQDGFKKLNVSVEEIHSSRSVERAMFKNLFGPYKRKKVVYYTLRVEAKW